MRLLPDTHRLLWWLAGDDALSGTARGAIGVAGNDIFAVLRRRGRTRRSIGLENCQVLRHGQVAGSLAAAHRDPFDRMLIAQAMLENLVLVSNESACDAFGVMRLRYDARSYRCDVRLYNSQKLFGSFFQKRTAASLVAQRPR